MKAYNSGVATGVASGVATGVGSGVAVAVATGVASGVAFASSVATALGVGVASIVVFSVVGNPLESPSSATIGVEMPVPNNVNVANNAVRLFFRKFITLSFA